MSLLLQALGSCVSKTINTNTKLHYTWKRPCGSALQRRPQRRLQLVVGVGGAVSRAAMCMRGRNEWRATALLQQPAVCEVRAGMAQGQRAQRNLQPQHQRPESLHAVRGTQSLRDVPGVPSAMPYGHSSSAGQLKWPYRACAQVKRSDLPCALSTKRLPADIN